MGLRLDTELTLTDKLEYVPVDAVTLEQAKAQALKSRPDLEAQQQREARRALIGERHQMERLPSVAAFGDYGVDRHRLRCTRCPRVPWASRVRVPIFDGGRRDARRAESASQYRAEKVQTGDLKEQIELDVRLALDALRSADEQVKVAKEGLELAENELTQARRRYEAGVAIGLEVTDAQSRLERARDNQITALYNYNVGANRPGAGHGRGAQERGVGVDSMKKRILILVVVLAAAGRRGVGISRHGQGAGQPPADLRQHRAERGEHRLQDRGPAGGAHGGRRRRREEGAGDRAAGPRSVAGAARARDWPAWRPRESQLAQAQTALEWQRASVAADLEHAPRRCRVRRGAPGGTAERRAPAGEAGSPGRGGRGGQRGGARAARLGARADAVQERRHLDRAVRPVPQPLREHRRPC